MKYSIFTTANKSYYPFLDIFTSSAIRHCNNLEKIYIADSGLGEYRNFISNKQKSSLIDTNCSDEYSGVHSSGWVKATQMKTKVLNNLLNENEFDHSIIMIDSDVCILKDIESIIDNQYDIQVTTMKGGGHTRSDGIFISEIASFVVFNNISKCRIFIQNWIDKMEEFGNNNTPFPHETPAMNIVLRDSEDLKIGYLKELEVCADSELSDKTYTVHFKSNGSTKDNAVVNFERRIMSVKNNTDSDLILDEFLNEEIYDKWRSEYE